MGSLYFQPAAGLLNIGREAGNCEDLRFRESAKSCEKGPTVSNLTAALGSGRDHPPARPRL
jgi:hypothetical protein